MAAGAGEAISCALLAPRYDAPMSRIAAIVLAVPLCVSCVTTFHGDPKVPNGAAGCKAVCDGYGMDLVGMVAMGEYSDGCICQVRGKSLATPSTAAVSAAVVGVVTAMESQRQAASQQSMAASK
jgi:hypothetical protein